MAKRVTNFTEYFREEKDVYVQNMANAQVSVEFPVSPNHNEGYLFLNNRDPVNLTQQVPFEAIKGSMDFRKMLARRPPALQLLSEEEYSAYYENKARRMGMQNNEGNPDVDAAIDATEERRRRSADRNTRETVVDKAPPPIHEVIERGTGPGGATHFGERERVVHEDAVGEDEIINPRVLHLCNQVKSELEPEERMPARELLDALQDIPALKLDDYEYVRAHGYYKGVKKWAKKCADQIASSDDGVEDGLTDEEVSSSVANTSVV